MTPTLAFPPELLLAAQGVRVAFFDVDGVLTDGGLYLSDQGESLKRFHILDGLGLKLLQRAGITPVVITGRDSAPLRLRLAALGIDGSWDGSGGNELLDTLLSRLTELFQVLPALLFAMVRRGEAARVSALFFLIPPVAALIAMVLVGMVSVQVGASFAKSIFAVGGAAGVAAAGAEAVDGAIAGEGERPGEGGAAGGLERGGFFPDGDEGVVDDVLRLGGVVQNAEGGGVERAGETVVEFGEGGAVTGGDKSEQACVGRVAGVGLVGGAGVGHAGGEAGRIRPAWQGGARKQTGGRLRQQERHGAVESYA